MIQKIISGGQTGADQAALDVAIKLDIPHGGWIPKGRKTEAGILPEKYQLKEISTASYPKRTEKNVVDSDGTLIMTHGKLTGGSALTKKIADKNGRSCLHIDLNETIALTASLKIAAWIEKNSISVLNVAGSRASKDAEIYDAVKDILESAYILGLSKAPDPGSLQQSYQPRTINDAVGHLLSELSLKDKASIANMAEGALLSLHYSLGQYIRNSFGIWEGNENLLSDCRSLLKKDKIQEDEVSSFIIKKLWEKLRKTHRLKVVK